MYILEEQDYIESILKGDSSAYRFLVNKHKKMVYSIALGIFNNAEDAEDAAQDSFLKAYQQLHTFKSKSKFSTWLYTITYRICITKLNYRSIDTTGIKDDVIENYTANHLDSPFAQLLEAEQQKFMKAAIQKLPKIDVVLIMLYYFDENSLKEIEEITGLTASNIKVKLFRARKFLEKELKLLL